MTTKLVVDRLVLQRGARMVLDGVGFSVGSGQALAVTGPNGAGKSSLLRAIAGLLRPVSGSITLTGSDPELTVGEQCHYLGHLDPVKPALTVAENLTFWTKFLGSGGGLTAEALAAVGLAELTDLPGGYLSAGQRRRLSLARLVAVHRPVWLLDEPTSALDTAAQSRFADLVARHLAAGGIVVAATHLPLGIREARELRLSPVAPMAAEVAAS